MVVSFSHDNPRDPSTWIDTTAHLVHPTYPYQQCVISGAWDPGTCPPGVSDFIHARSSYHDIGLVVLARPVANIAPATLALAGDLEGAFGQPMTVVGYGCDPRAVRNFGAGTLAELSERVAWYNHDLARQCSGDSGGPTFHKDRVVSLVSGGDGRSFRFRVDHPGVLSWIAGVVDAVSDVVAAVEFYNAALDHYFLTWIPEEIAILDAGVTIKGWTRTGQRIPVYSVAKTDASPVCRFYLPPAFGDSHFYGRGAAECDATARNHPEFVLEDSRFMHMVLPAAGSCPENTTTIKRVFRVFSNRPDANHRYMTDPKIRDEMVAKGWVAEGDGIDLVTMCGPQ